MSSVMCKRCVDVVTVGVGVPRRFCKGASYLDSVKRIKLVYYNIYLPLHRKNSSFARQRVGGTQREMEVSVANNYKALFGGEKTLLPHVLDSSHTSCFA
jgi:hypothetical protein